MTCDSRLGKARFAFETVAQLERRRPSMQENQDFRADHGTNAA
jgi:hypothetical protein